MKCAALHQSNMAKTRQLEFFFEELEDPAIQTDLPSVPQASEPSAVSPDALSRKFPLSLQALPQKTDLQDLLNALPPKGASTLPSGTQGNYAIKPPSLPPESRWRTLHVENINLGFILRRSRRKSIGLTICDDGLTVIAPHWATLTQVDEAVEAKAAWILRKLAERQKRKEQTATAETAWQHQGTIPYFGVRIQLMLGEQHTTFTGMPFTPQEGDCLLLSLPMQADRNRVRDAVHAWLQQQAQAWFGLRLEHFLQKGQLCIKRWRLSSAATRWGSCSSEGNIMLNWRLIHFSHDVVDYVIAHEVAHLREMNHSARFWQEVGKLMPGFESARHVLKAHSPDTLPLI